MHRTRQRYGGSTPKDLFDAFQCIGIAPGLDRGQLSHDKTTNQRGLRANGIETFRHVGDFALTNVKQGLHRSMFQCVMFGGQHGEIKIDLDY